jgi:DNA polymerase/3'-5' exonuclease PolX
MDTESMGTLFYGLRFLFLPNTNVGVTKIRSNLAKAHGALICDKFKPIDDPDFTTHVLVDNKVVPTSGQLMRMLHDEGLKDKSSLNVPVVRQEWLVDCVENKNILPVNQYFVELGELPDYQAFMKHNDSPKKRKLVPPKSSSSSASTESSSHEPKKHADTFETLKPKEKIHHNPNQQTIDILLQMAEQHKLRGEEFRVKAYKIAIDTLQKTPKYIMSYREAVKLPGIGSGIAKKIEEISKTSHLKQLDAVKESKESRLLKLFKGIHGVGPVFAKKWLKEGMSSLQDIASREDLTHNQKLGLIYYDDWNEKIPRKECTVHNEYVKHLFRQIDPDVQATIGGSYRRGASSCGDIDFILTKPGANIEELQDILERLVEKIREVGYYKCALQGKVSNKWLGGCALPPEWNKKATDEEVVGKCRRVDFLLVPWKEIGAAMIYFTGNDEFNKKLRYRAQKRGMVLNGTGLFKIIKDGKSRGHQELVESSDEKRILELLDVEWHDPVQRDIGGIISWD